MLLHELQESDIIFKTIMQVLQVLLLCFCISGGQAEVDAALKKQRKIERQNEHNQLVNDNRELTANLANLQAIVDKKELQKQQTVEANKAIKLANDNEQLAADALTEELQQKLDEAEAKATAEAEQDQNDEIAENVFYILTIRKDWRPACLPAK